MNNRLEGRTRGFASVSASSLAFGEGQGHSLGPAILPSPAPRANPVRQDFPKSVAAVDLEGIPEDFAGLFALVWTGPVYDGVDTAREIGTDPGELVALAESWHPDWIVVAVDARIAPDGESIEGLAPSASGPRRIVAPICPYWSSAGRFRLGPEGLPAELVASGSRVRRRPPSPAPPESLPGPVAHRAAG
jgi:hypothetical protein